jgi:Cys-tRNA(Pro)/Cys-tRNA(Cys) deacylase
MRIAITRLIIRSTLMTPAIKLLEKAKVIFNVHEYEHDPAAESYGLEASEKLGIDDVRVFKTLVVMLDAKEYAVAVIPVAHMLSMKHIAKAAGAKKAAMADRIAVERVTGYVLGGVSPVGQKKLLKTFIDESAQQHSTIYVSAGRRGLEIELAASDLKTQTSGTFTQLIQD